MSEHEHVNLSSPIIPDGVNGKGSGLSFGAYYAESFLLNNPAATAEDIRKHLEERTGRTIGPGTVYAIIGRLQEEDKVEEQGRGGKGNVKKYTANEEAKKDVSRAKEELLRQLALPDGFDNLLREEARKTREARESLLNSSRELRMSDQTFQSAIDDLASREKELLHQADLLSRFQKNGANGEE